MRRPGNSWLGWAILVVVAAVAAGAAHAKEPDRGARLYSFQRLAPENGLSSSTVTALLQDRQGYIWIGTTDGLNRYDGYEVHVFRFHPEDPSGISGSFISDLALDSQGNLWVFPGIGGADVYDSANDCFMHVRFEGHDASMGLPHVIGIASDADGQTWVATRGGLYLRRRGCDTVLHAVARDPHGRGGSPVRAVAAMASDGAGTIWIGTPSGLIRLRPRAPQPSRGSTASGLDSLDRELPADFRAFLPPPSPAQDQDGSGSVTALAIEPGGAVWVGTAQGTVFRLDHESPVWERAIPSGGVWSKEPGDGNGRSAIRQIVCDSLGGTWILPQGAGLARATAGMTLEPVRAGLLARSTVSAIVPLEDGILVGTERGLVKLSQRTEPLVFRHVPDDPSSLGANVVTAGLRDRRGGWWIGTTGGGVSHYDPWQARFRSAPWPPPELPDPSFSGVTAVLEDHRGRLWIGTQGGLVLAGAKTTVYPLRARPGGPALACLSLLEDHGGRLWVGTSGGLVRVLEGGRDGSGPIRFAFVGADHAGAPSIHAMVEDPHEGLWLATDRGLLWIDPERGRSRGFGHDPADPATLPSSSCAALAVTRDGDLWIGTYVGGLSRFDRAHETFENFVPRPGRADGLNNLSVQSICPSRDGRTLWIGTYSGGLNRLDLDTRTFRAITERQGLPGDKVNAVLEDRSGRIWLTTNRGLARLDPATGRITPFDSGDGLPGDEFLPRAAAVARNGELIVGGSSGYCRFDPDGIASDPLAPPVVLTAFRCFDRVVPLGQVVDGRGRIALSYRDDFVAFEFAALEYSANPRARYAYRMDGFDRDWVESGPRRYAAYTNLDPGRYTFRVRAANRDGVWNDAGFSVPVTTVPPFWRTAWFGALAAGAAASLLLLLHQRRVRSRVRRSLESEQIRAAERERVRGEVARDYHDEVGVLITRITLYAELLRRKLDAGAAAEARTYQEKIAASTQAMTLRTREFLWALDPRRSRVSDLLSHLEEIGRPLFDESDTRFEVRLADPPTARTLLSAERKRQLALLFREAMHNARQHAGAGRVELTAQRTGSRLRIEIRDDGRGFAAAERHAGQGVENLRARAVEAGGQVLIETAPGQGTRIRFEGSVDGS